MLKSALTDLVDLPMHLIVELGRNTVVIHQQERSVLVLKLSSFRHRYDLMMVGTLIAFQLLPVLLSLTVQRAFVSGVSEPYRLGLPSVTGLM
jgi:hypothetical protein